MGVFEREDFGANGSLNAVKGKAGGVRELLVVDGDDSSMLGSVGRFDIIDELTPHPPLLPMPNRLLLLYPKRHPYPVTLGAHVGSRQVKNSI